MVNRSVQNASTDRGTESAVLSRMLRDRFTRRKKKLSFQTGAERAGQEPTSCAQLEPEINTEISCPGGSEIQPCDVWESTAHNQG